MLALAASSPSQQAAVEEPAWPTLAAKDDKRVATLIRRLETGAEADAAKALSELATLGAAVVPHLLRRMALPRQTDQAMTAVEGALDTIVRQEHGPLVLKVADDRALPARRWAIRWLTLHTDERWREVLTRHAVPPPVPEGKPNQKPVEPPDADIVFCANLALAALRDTEALARVMETCHTAWRERHELVGRVLPAARSSEMASWVIRQMRPDDERSRVTGLRMLRYLAPKDYAGAIALYLDSGESSVKREAINALRAVVDGDAPVEELSVFSAIEQAKSWKERLK